MYTVLVVVAVFITVLIGLRVYHGMQSGLVVNSYTNENNYHRFRLYRLLVYTPQVRGARAVQGSV